MDSNLAKCILVLFFGQTWCFLARNIISGSGTGNVYTHLSLTNVGCLKAVDEYIIKVKNVTSMDEFFTKDSSGSTKVFTAAASIGQHVANTQAAKKEKAYIHCHADKIEFAHRSVKSCKRSLLLVKDDLELLKETMGECLYTIQSFYSNTNWIEMKGPVTYDDFGTNDIMEVASLEEDTCIDVADTNGDCRNNIIVREKLASGYYAGRGNTKPKATGLTGKCSHGGVSDQSSTLVPRCGINKDTNIKQYSPHYHLHSAASTAAIEATKKFLVENGTGILDLLGERIFDRLFDIRVEVNASLAFAIDYTASMTPEMTDVKNTVIDILTSVVGSSNEPADYVLSLFHDPPTMNHAYKYEDGYDMINHIHTIQTTPGNNPDCPEYAVAGMINAIHKMRDNSPLLVFTDADAKDAQDEHILTGLAISKNISINPFISSQCGKKRRTQTGRRSQRSLSFFDRIAQATGGTLIENNKQNTASFLKSFLEEQFPTEEVMIDSFQWPTGENDTKVFPVDSTISVLKISVVGLSTKENVEIYYENGTLETFTSGQSISITTLEGKAIYSIQKPMHGFIKIVRKEKYNLMVNVTAQSGLNAYANLYQLTSSGGSIRINDEDNPIAGSNYTLEVAVYNLQQNASLEELLFISIGISVLMVHTCTMYNSFSETRCQVEFVMPNESFQIKLTGIDSNAYNFSRLLPTVYNPTNVHLDVSTANDYATLNKHIVIKYNITNYGTESEVYVLDITSSVGSVIIGPSSAEYNVTSQSFVEGSFTFQTTASSSIVTYTVTLTSAETNEVQQRITNKLLVSEVDRPVCSLSETSIDCHMSTDNTGDCSSQKWIIIGNVTFSGVQLESISADQAITISHKDFTNMLSGPLEITISGTCCTPTVYITIIDVDDYISQCVIGFATVETVASDIETDESMSSGLITALSILSGLLSAMVFIGLYFYFKPTAFDRKSLYAGTERADTVSKPTFKKDFLKENFH